VTSESTNSWECCKIESELVVVCIDPHPPATHRDDTVPVLMTGFSSGCLGN